MSDIYKGTIEGDAALSVYSICFARTTDDIDLAKLQRTSDQHPECRIDIYLGLGEYGVYLQYTRQQLLELDNATLESQIDAAFENC